MPRETKRSAKALKKFINNLAIKTAVPVNSTENPMYNMSNTGRADNTGDIGEANSIGNTGSADNMENTDSSENSNVNDGISTPKKLIVEKITGRRLTKRQIIKAVAISAACGLIFGITAAGAFYGVVNLRDRLRQSPGTYSDNAINNNPSSRLGQIAGQSERTAGQSGDVSPDAQTIFSGASIQNKGDNSGLSSDFTQDQGDASGLLDGLTAADQVESVILGKEDMEDKVSSSQGNISGDGRHEWDNGTASGGNKESGSSGTLGSTSSANSTGSVGSSQSGSAGSTGSAGGSNGSQGGSAGRTGSAGSSDGSQGGNAGSTGSAGSSQSGSAGGTDSAGGSNGSQGGNAASGSGQISGTSDSEDENDIEQISSEDSENDADIRKSILEMKDARNAVRKELEQSLVKVSATSTASTWFDSEASSTEVFSGIIIDIGEEEILVLTSSNVANSDSMKVMFGNGISVDAYIKQVSETDSLAVLAVSSVSGIDENMIENLKAIEIVPEDEIETGEPLIACGSPLGMPGSVAFGDAGYTDHSEVWYDGCITVIYSDMRADADKGTFAVDYDGRLIGIISSTVSNSIDGEYARIVSADSIIDIINALKNGKKLPYLGIKAMEVTFEMRYSGMPEGCFVRDIEQNKAAYSAGIMRGDIVTSINGTAVHDMEEYANELKKCLPGDEIELTINRQAAGEYREMNFTLTTGER